MSATVLSKLDEHMLLDVINACHVKSNSFDDDVYPKLRALQPHRMFVYGIADFRADRNNLCHIGGNFPASFIDDESTGRRSTLQRLVKEWFSVRKPVYWSSATDDRYRADGLPELATALHGVADAGNQSATWFAFGKSAFDSRDDYIIRVIVPHLHAALGTNAARTQRPSWVEPLTPREREVLQWLSKGKANAEIGIVLGISICTVRVHIQNIFKKLHANNRTHAAARAMQLGLLDVEPVPHAREPRSVHAFAAQA
jgi:DNA-binding CsgD family transcriptional regulator